MKKIKCCEECPDFYQNTEEGLHGSRFPVDDCCKRLEGAQEIDRDDINELGRNCPKRAKQEDGKE